MFIQVFVACKGFDADSTGEPVTSIQEIETYYLATSSPEQGSISIRKNTISHIDYISKPQPDLIIESITWLPERFSRGDNVIINVTVKNQGNARVLSPQLVFRSNGFLEDSIYLSGFLAPGESVIKSFTLKALQGSTIIKMIVDEEESVRESDEYNNTKTMVISALAPDLIIDDVTWSPLSPQVNYDVTFSATIKNKGEGKAFPTLVFLCVDGVRLDIASIGSIGPGDNVSVNLKCVREEGVHIIEIIADANNREVESEENNNIKIVDLPLALPDFIVKNITWTPTNPRVGYKVTFTVTVKNQGTNVGCSNRLSFYAGGGTSDWDRIETSRVGSTLTKTFTWIAEAGENTIRAVVDPDNLCAELNEDNNEMRLTFSGARPPDLIIDSITWSPPEPAIGETITVSVTIKNKGEGNAKNSRVTYYIDDYYVISANIKPISYGRTLTKTFRWTVQPGYHRIKAVVDEFEVISEANEYNNGKAVVFPKPPDLVIKAITVSPSKPVEGDNVTFTIDVENQGAEMSDNYSITYYIDDDYLDRLFVEKINPGETVIYTYQWDATNSPHSIKAIVDLPNLIIESDEYNNDLTVRFSEEQADVTTDQPEEIIVSKIPVVSSPTAVPDEKTDVAPAEVTVPTGETTQRTSRETKNKSGFVYFIYSFIITSFICGIFIMFVYRRTRLNKSEPKPPMPSP